MYTEEQIEKAREYPIHTLLGLSHIGRAHNRCCPFHNEKTPSFTLYPDNHWHCYGCGSHGKGAIDFVIELTNCTFGEAMEELVKLN